MFSGQWQFLISVEAHNWSLLSFFLGAIHFFCFGNVISSFASGDSIFSQRCAGLCVMKWCPKASSILIHSELCGFRSASMAQNQNHAEKDKITHSYFSKG